MPVLALSGSALDDLIGLRGTGSIESDGLFVFDEGQRCIVSTNGGSLSEPGEAWTPDGRRSRCSLLLLLAAHEQRLLELFGSESRVVLHSDTERESDAFARTSGLARAVDGCEALSLWNAAP